MHKRACVYVGHLLASAITDAFNGTVAMTYPYYEMHAVREVGAMLDSPNANPDIVIIIMVLGLFEVGGLFVVQMTSTGWFANVIAGVAYPFWSPFDNSFRSPSSCY